MWKMEWYGVVMGHPRLLKIAPFDRAHTSSLTISLSCTVSEIWQDISRK